MTTDRRVLICLDSYLPGSRGGALRSVVNTVETLGDRFDFHILTRDRDAPDAPPYDGITPNTWTRLGPALVQHLTPDRLTRSHLARLTRDTAPGLLYVSSVFSTLSIRMLMERRFGTLRDLSVALAPDGELAAWALATKRAKKAAYLTLARLLRLYDGLLWRASSERERDDILRVMGAQADVRVAPNLPAVHAPAPTATAHATAAAATPVKRPGEIRLALLSRLGRNKGLLFALDRVAELRGEITLDFYGPIEDRAHWLECEARVARLPPNVSVLYGGNVPSGDVVSTLRRYHAFILPTAGENFGHAILEALEAGCPAVISDQTPWRDLEAAHAGWQIPLTREDRWRGTLQRLVDMDEPEYRTWSDGAERFAAAWTVQSASVDALVSFLDEGLSRGGLSRGGLGRGGLGRGHAARRP